MSEEIKKTETPENPDLSEQELENVAGGKTRNETRSNTSAYGVIVPTSKPPAPSAG